MCIYIRKIFAFILGRFIINIQTGAALEPSDDKNLHLSIRPSERIIVRNHMANRNWGAEERNGGCPIVAGQSFEILILAETDSFKVSCDCCGHQIQNQPRFDFLGGCERNTFLSIHTSRSIGPCAIFPCEG